MRPWRRRGPPGLSDSHPEPFLGLLSDGLPPGDRLLQLREALAHPLVAELAELRIRNLKCFDELQSFNDNGKWLNRNPLLQGKSEIAELRSLLQHDPDEFLRLQRCCADSVRRYQSYLKRKDRRAYRQSDREALARYRDRLRLFTSVLRLK